MPGTSTRVLPRSCAMSGGTLVTATSAGIPCESKTSRTAVNWLLWLRNIPRTNSCVGVLIVYLGGMVTEEGHSAAEVRRRTQAEANAWIKVEGVMLDRKISKS